MTPISNFILALWIVFWFYWLISALAAKRNIRRAPVGPRIFIILAVILLLQFPQARAFFFANRNFMLNPWIAGLGALLCVAGIALAVWARLYLGKNWGMPMSLKENPELVTTGPYRFVRHPIYSGILLAMLGSALASGLLWLLVFILFGSYFVYAAHTEEQIMQRQFPGQYPAYQKRTNALIPFIW